MAVAGVLPVSADDALYLHVQDNAGNWKVISLENADKLTFKNNGMQVLDAKGTELQAFDSSQLKSMKVNESASAGIGAVAAEDEKAAFSISGKVVTAAAEGSLCVYGLSGTLYVEIPAVKAGQTVDLSQLPANVYVVKLNGYTSKIEL